MSLDNEIQSVDAADTPQTIVPTQEPVDTIMPSTSSDAEEDLEAQLALKNLEKRRKDKRRKRRMRILVGCALAGGIIAAVIGSQFNQGADIEDEEYVPETAIVERRDFESIITASGALKAGSTTVVTPEVDGTIESVQVTEGQAVEKGDVLFTVKNDELDKAIRDAQQELDEAGRAVGTAQEAVTQAVEERDAEWNTYYAAYAEAEEAHKEWANLVKNYDKLHKAWAKRAAAAEKLKVAEPVEPKAPTAPDPSAYSDEDKEPGGQYEKDQATYQQLNVDYQKAFASYQKALTDWTAYQAALAKVGEEPEPAGEEPEFPEEPKDTELQAAIKDAQEGVTTASQTYAKAQETYDETVKQAEGRTVKAPTNGNIVALNAKVGASTLGSSGEAGVGDELVLISNMKQMAVDIEVNEIDILSIEKGQKAKVTFSAVPDAECEATVSEVSSVASGEGGGDGSLVTFHVGLIIPKPDKRLRAGMTANVEIITASAKDALVIPTSALSEGVDGHSVEVVLDEEDPYNTETRPVVVGVSNSSESVIEQGLSEDEIVLLAGGMDEFDEEF